MANLLGCSKMCLSSWYIYIGIIFIILQEISIKSTAMGKDEGCRKQEKFATSLTFNNRNNFTIQGFDIKCTFNPTVFEVRFTNGLLCACGRHERKDTTLHKNCVNQSPLAFMVNMSVDTKNPSGENCAFSFSFREGKSKITASLGFFSPQIVTSSFVVSRVVSSVVTRVITSYFTSTVSTLSRIDHTSSLLIRQSEQRNSTTSSRRISSTISTPQSSKSSYVITQSSHEIPQSSYVIPQSSYVFPQSSHAIPQSSHEIPQSSYVFPQISHAIPQSSHAIPKSSHATPQSSNVIPYYTPILIPAETKTPILQPTSSLPTLPVLVTSSMEEIPVLKTSTVIAASPTTSVVLTTTTLSPEAREMKKLKEDMEFIKNINTSAVNVNDEKTIGRVLDAVANLINTNVTVDQKEDPGEQAVAVLENLGNSISQQLDLGNQSSVTFQRVTADLVFGAAVINVTSSPGFSFPADKDLKTGNEKVDIPKSVFVSQSGKAYFVGIIFKAYREMRNNTGNESFVMGTKVINAIVSPAPSDVLIEPVEMTFKKNIIGQTFAEEACSFWIENSSLIASIGDHGRWSTNHCRRASGNKTHVKCACHHFTNFAVLFKVSDDKNSEADSFRLAIITYVGLSLSILGCLLTFIIYVAFSNIKSDRAIIHVNLVLALGIADVIFLVAVAVKPEGDSCLAVAMLAFYFYLAVFFWMLVEGVYIYLMVIKVFRGNVARRRQFAYLVGWVCPILIPMITWAVLSDDIVSKYHCWLSVESGAIWAFVGPALSIILVNLVILMAVMRTTWATFVDDKEYGGLRSATKTFGAVIPILGITWVFGVMAFNESSVVFQYIFAITNSIQGALIFVLYCIVNNEVRSELKRRIVVWQTRRDLSSSSGGTRRPTYAISSEKNTTFNRTTPSAEETPDISQYQLQEINKKPSGQVEVGYTFDSLNNTPQNDSELGKEDKNGGVLGEGADKDSGRSSPVVETKQNDAKVNDAYDQTVRYV